MTRAGEANCFFSNIEEQASDFMQSFSDSRKNKDYLNEYSEEEALTKKQQFNCTVKFEKEVASE